MIVVMIIMLFIFVITFITISILATLVCWLFSLPITLVLFTKIAIIAGVLTIISTYFWEYLQDHRVIWFSANGLDYNGDDIHIHVIELSDELEDTRW